MLGKKLSEINDGTIGGQVNGSNELRLINLRKQTGLDYRMVAVDGGVRFIVGSDLMEVINER